MTPLFDWDIHNVEHIARHGITPDEAEYAFHHTIRFCQVTNDHIEYRRCIIGMHPNGKFVKLIYNLRDGKYRIVTAHFTG